MAFNQQLSKSSDTKAEERTSLSDLLTSSMAARSLSLRGLGRLCGINPSTLSRLMNNKQSPSMRHLQLFSEHLKIPFEQLLSASGIEVEITKNGTNYDTLFMDMIFDVLKSYDIEMEQVVVEVKKELKKFERYAATEEAQETIRNEFPAKLKNLNGEGLIINYLQKLYQLFCKEDTEHSIRSLAGSALLYLILTPDVIPDYAFPVGYLDDALVVILVVNRLSDEFHISLM